METASDETNVSTDDPFFALRDGVQKSVIDAALDYIGSAPTREREASRSFGRIVLPPRVGKTRVAGEIIRGYLDRFGDCVTFLAPKTVLVDQAADEFEALLPGVPVFRLYQGSRELGERGVVVSTYDSACGLMKRGVPPIFSASKLVFVDEAHHSMTQIKQGLLQQAFPEVAVRLALTATPDYDEERVLSRHFPDLIHEMTVYEGVRMKLLAPVRASVFEVAAGPAGKIRIVGGDYDASDMARIMGRAPLLQAVREFRYSQHHRDIPALIACTTRAQARLVWDYLVENGPQDSPVPGLVLGDMDPDARRKMLRNYECGRIDTLITVGVLIEGWNSPRCKLLIDAAPSLSQVRAAQKYTRPMTKDGDKEAKIVVLVPMGMDEVPVLPLDVFGPGLEELLDEFPGPKRHQPGVSGPKSKTAWEMLDRSGVKVASVSAKMRMVEEMLIDRLDIQSTLKAVREIVDAYFGGYLGIDFYHFGRFMNARFSVGDIRISGRQVLRFLGYRPTYRGFAKFMARYYPKVVADRWLTARGFEGSTRARSFGMRRDDILRSLDMADEEGLINSQEEIADESWWSVLEQPSGPLADVPNESIWPLCRESVETRSPDDLCIEREWADELVRLLDTLPPREAHLLRLRFGLDGEDELTFKEIGDRYGVSRERVRQIQMNALAKIRRQIKE